TIGRAGSLVIYFRSPVEVLGTSEVALDVNGAVVQAHTISALGEGVWQCNLLLNDPVPATTPVRVRLGTGRWSESLQTIRM
ncbi:MAG TPA: hypothetical protein VNH18_26065, partial [Bryobacteraceae bacterium]|nr:hypothetical protein [Bryobacteraceae bacterium]